MILFLVLSLVNVALQVVTYRRARAYGHGDTVDAAAIAVSLWLMITAYQLVQVLGGK